MSKNCLLIPLIPPSDIPEAEQLAMMDIKLEGGKREDYMKTSDRLEKRANVIFAQYRCTAYIGRAWQMLVIYLNMPMRQ